MDKTAWSEVLPAGFFAMACMQAHGRFKPGRKMSFVDFFHMTGRLQKLRRSRWQWLSMVAIMLLLRLQRQSWPTVEIVVWIMFLVLIIVAVQALVRVGI